MSLTQFPFETTDAKVDVVLPVGRHALKLVVTDNAGTMSQPDSVWITVQPVPRPAAQSVTPDRVFKGTTVDAVIHGQHLSGVTSITAFRDAQEDESIVVTIRDGATDSRVPITIAVMAHAQAGLRSLVVTTTGGVSAVGFTVLSAEGIRIRNITPRRGQVGLSRPLAVRIDGDNLEGATEATFLRGDKPDEGITAVIRAAQPDYVDAEVSISVNAEFGRRGLALTTPVGTVTSPPTAPFVVSPGLLQAGIILLTLITAVVHIAWDFPNTLFVLNGLGYIGLLFLLYAPMPWRATVVRPPVRWALLIYAVITIVAWVAIGDRGIVAYVTKAVEALLVVLLFIESRQN